MQGVLCVTESEEGDAPCALMWGAFQGQDGTEGLWGRVDRKSPSKKTLLSPLYSWGQRKQNSTPKSHLLPHLQPGPGAA